MVGRTRPRGLLYALLLSPVLASLLLSGLIPPSTGPTVYATPSSYSWNSLRTNTVSIAYSVDERAWYGGTGYLSIVTNGPGTYGDAKECVASVNIPQGFPVLSTSAATTIILKHLPTIIAGASSTST